MSEHSPDKKKLAMRQETIGTVHFCQTISSMYLVVVVFCQGYAHSYRHSFS